MAGPSVCSFCNRWWSTSGAPICGLCRIARAVAALPLDNRVNNTNYDLATSILERALGEVNSWLAVPLAEAQGTVENIPSTPGSGAVEGDLHSGEDSPRSRDLGKDKRSDRQQERRAERREVKRQPPPPPPAPARSSRDSRAHSPPLATRERHIGQHPTGSDCFVQRRKKTNKGKKHRERGHAYQAWRRGEE